MPLKHVFRGSITRIINNEKQAIKNDTDPKFKKEL